MSAAEQQKVDVVVVGAGVMGAATAWWLTRSGATTLLIERFHIGHNRGSSHGSSRIFRLSYPDTRYVRMAQEALELWRQAEAESGEELLLTTGGLDLGPGIEANHAALAECGASSEMLTEQELKSRFEFLNCAGPGLFQADSGIVRAERAWSTFAAMACDRGAKLVEGTVVERVEASAEGAIVHTVAGRIECRACVVTAGAWAQGLLAGAGIEIDTRPTRESVFYFSYTGPPPPTVAEWVTPLRYALPAPEVGLKVGEHLAGPTTDPDALGKVDSGSRERMESWAAARFPGLGELLHAETCLYTNTPDASFVLERHGSIVVGSPCSGHGFKFAPLTGKRLAEFALGS
ncbi:MAG TPA: FAD-dependent oxidoreductase [Actinomycetota bacterium]|nr:FAD-dependent oxidoreductase [Actinomycetota bacterium]